MAYQDIWIKGQTTQKGERSCEARYDLIREVVKPYTRQITVWDLGANLGYFGCRLAEEFGSVSVMVEKHPPIVGVCRQNALPTTIVLNKTLAGHELADLARSEHADVVLALSFIHRVPDWKPMLDAVLALGEDIVIELPARNETTVKNYHVVGDLSDAVEALRPELIGTASIPQSPTIRRPIYLIRRGKTVLNRACVKLERLRKKGPEPPRAHRIVSTHETKTIAFEKGESRSWIHGMNLWNWAVMGGAYPDRPVVETAVKVAAGMLDRAHGDFKPWNLILQGDRVVPIDYGHRNSSPDVSAAATAIKLLRHPESAFVR